MEPLYRPHGRRGALAADLGERGPLPRRPGAPGEAYAIAVPPPNVTGALHMGHALNGSIQDALIRWHRMRGFNTLWQPGFDHAGISTQAVVERELRKQGTSRQELGRDAFVERVWEWLHEYGGIIMSQFRRLGCSLDYERERFTMDDAYIRAVMRFFVHLYERGWLFRDNRIINWCTDCQTSISDLEVEYIDLDDSLTYARYPLVDGERLRDDRDRAPRDDPRRRRRRGAPGRRALRAAGRQGGARAGRGARRADRSPTSASRPTSARAR